MEERFELSFKNKEVRMWCYIMIPTVLISIIFTITMNSPISPILHFTPTIGWILYGIWRYFFKKSRKR